MQSLMLLATVFWSCVMLAAIRLLAVAQSPPGRFFSSIGAGPVENTNLTVALLSVVPVLVLGCVFFVIGSHYLPRDQEKASAGKDASGIDTEGFVGLGH